MKLSSENLVESSRNFKVSEFEVNSIHLLSFVKFGFIL